MNSPLTDSRSGAPSKLSALGGLRGIAVLMVVLFHLRFGVGDPTSHIPDLARSMKQPEISSVFSIVCFEMACFLAFAGLNTFNASRNRVRWRTALVFVALFGAGAAVSDASFRVVAVATALVIGLAANGHGLDRWFRGRVFQFLGRVSLSLYLTHSFVFSSCSFVVAEFLGTALSAQFVFVVVALAASMLVAWVTWAFVQRPAARWATRVSLRPRGRYRSIDAWPELSVADRVAMLVYR